MREQQLKKSFQNPPPGYGIVPFYWWLGDPVTKEKLLYHLEQLEGYSISGLQINYAHSDRGGHSWGLTYPGEPAVFSEEWWDMAGFFLQEAKKRGIAVSLSDYTLGSPGQGYYADEILQENPEACGHLLMCERMWVEKGDIIRVSAGKLWSGRQERQLPEEWEFVCAAIRDGDTYYPVMELSQENSGLPEGRETGGEEIVFGEITYNGELLFVYSTGKAYSIDPMYPDIGDAYIRHFFGRFEEHFPGEGGKGLNFFFSDELDFGIRGNLWNAFFPEEFRKRKGYDLRPLAYLIFEEGKEAAVKVRLDYYDVIVQLEEENYFSRVFQWHEDRGMTYGCDHGGRGKDVTEFGDYMRTQKYNQGVGCDQPNLQSDIIKNKVASSISHLYCRPRVWLEGFYGSGWGTSTEQLMDAIARNFVMGHNLLSLHGFYYSTHGGFWEWAPPCNCVRAPYWKDMKSLTNAVERLSFLLSRGVHSCHIGIVYPVAAVEGGIEGEKAVDTAFSIGEMLYRQGIDFDFLDYESIQRAETEKGALCVSGERYETVILPHMLSVRWGMYEKLAEASKDGVSVIAAGCWPLYGDGDMESAGQILRQNGMLAADVEEAVRLAACEGKRDVVPEVTKEFYQCHRKIGALDLYMTYGVPVGEKCLFRGRGNAYLLSPWDGKIWKLPVEDVKNKVTGSREENAGEAEEGLWIRMPVESSEFPLIVLGELEEDGIWESMPEELTEETLEGAWDFQLLPTLDNTYGDFALPASKGILPCLVSNLHIQDRKIRAGFGPFLESKECFRNEEEFREQLKEAAIRKGSGYTEEVFSLRYGIEDDPGHQGYHGLKGNITDDFLRIGIPVEKATEIRMRPYENGTGKIFRMGVYAENPLEAVILTGSIKPDKLYVNGQDVTGQTKVRLCVGTNLVAAGYLKCGRTHLIFAREDSQENPCPLAMKWYRMEGMLPFVPLGKEKEEKCVYWFQAPPALEEIRMKIHGRLLEARAGGRRAEIRQEGDETVISIPDVIEECTRVELVILPGKGYREGAVFDGPLAVKCGVGKMEAGDWSQNDGLACYSGGASYSRVIYRQEKAGETGGRVWLEIEQVVATVEVYVNGAFAGIRVAPPWRVEIGSLLHPGENRLELRVFNTLGNYYEALPTRYKSGTASGLIGKVRLLSEKHPQGQESHEKE